MRNRKKGFTLIELVIAIAVFAIFSVGAIGIMFPVLQTYSAAIKLSEGRLMAFDIMDVVQNELQYAVAQSTGDIVVEDGGTEMSFTGRYGSTKITSAPDGHLYMARGEQIEYQPYYDLAYYKDYTANITFLAPAVGAKPVYGVMVQICDQQGELVCEVTGSTTPLTLYAAR